MGIDLNARALAARGYVKAFNTYPWISGEWVFNGDSILYNNIYSDNPGFANPSADSSLNYSARGQMAFASAISGGMYFTPDDVLAVGGSTSTDALQRMPAVLARMRSLPTCAGMVLNAGTNDVIADVSAATVYANLQACCRMANQQGWPVLWLPLLPRVAFTATQQRVADQVTSMMRLYARNNNGVIALNDLENLVNASDGAPRANTMYDGTHPGPLGAWLRGRAISNLMGPFNKLYRVAPDGMDAYNISDAGYGNLLGRGQGLFNGTTGTVTAPFTGTIAGSWGSTLTSGTPLLGTIVASKVAAADGFGDWQRLALTAVTDTESGAEIGFSRTITVSETTLLPGDRVEAWVTCKITAGATGLRGVIFRCTEQNGGSYNGYYAWNTQDIAAEWPTSEEMTLYLRTPPFTIREVGGVGNRRIITECLALADLTGSGCTATIDWRRAKLIKLSEA